ncbi:hypothetical protein FB45DRAFT_953490 [Roridomyces roridus]|uniref:F-box domain-containing protein n=1 Tax=Roridomyces roridus TaxID=1738132 RepID=A0AAD7AZH8_9AGAR|nr:hypothetical protein FB45DRAFT_953490 [Roridomyces roridus]
MDSTSCPQCGSLYITEPNKTIPAPTETLSGYHRLAKSNDPPPSAELAFLHTVALDTSNRLACLDDEISRLRRRLDYLESQRAQLSQYSHQNTAILSPLRRMPPEMLVQIFLWTLPSLLESKGDASDARGSPWALAQVSGRWREILHSFIMVDSPHLRPRPSPTSGYAPNATSPLRHVASEYPVLRRRGSQFLRTARTIRPPVETLRSVGDAQHSAEFGLGPAPGTASRPSPFAPEVMGTVGWRRKSGWSRLDHMLQNRSGTRRSRC